MTNGCAAEARIDAVELRRPGAAWSVETPGPIMIPAGGGADVRVRFAPGTAELLESILFLQVSAPEADRRPITLSGRGE